MHEYGLTEIARELGLKSRQGSPVSHQAVSQIEQRALRKCRQWCDAHGYRLADLLPDQPRSSGYAPPHGFDC